MKSLRPLKAINYEKKLNPCLQYCIRDDILEVTPIDEKIDFDHIARDGGNIFKCCLMPSLNVGSCHALARDDDPSRKTTLNELRESIQRSQNLEYEQSLLTPAIEKRFFKLVKAGEKYGFNTDKIIERPDSLGSTVFEHATLFSVNICKYILNRNIRVNNILVNFVYPVFNHDFNDEMWEKMLKKGINPKVISGSGLIYFIQNKLNKICASL